MSGGAPKGPRMTTLEKQNKQREDNDPEYKQQRLNSFQLFFTRTLQTSENPLTHPGTPACSTQTVSAAPTATTLPPPLPPSFRAASLPHHLLPPRCQNLSNLLSDQHIFRLWWTKLWKMHLQ